MDSGLEAYSYNMSCRTTGGFARKRNEGGDGRSSTTTEECDSTTEPVNPKAQFQVGDDVYYQEDTGQNVLGTVGLIQGKKMKIIFMDGTEKWAPYSRVKKISMNFNEDEEEVKSEPKYMQPTSPPTSEASSGGVSSGPTKKKSKCDLNGHAAPKEKETYQVTCGSCGTQKLIAPKRAFECSPHTTNQFNCRKCINKSKTNKNNGVPIIAAHYLAAARGRPRGPDTNGTMTPNKGILEHGIANGGFRPDADKICLHCRSPILERVSLNCTMCDRPCHPSCLTLTPPPLPGDTFWSIICHVCGTQKPDGSPENDSQKLYSSRRSITCWSDVALLLLRCLGCKHPAEKFFHLDDQVIPFWEENVTRLHLPRQYKTADPVERRRCLLIALKNAHLRFLQDESRDLWGILESKDLIKAPLLSGGRAVTAAGFPISVRANNPEAASAAMTNIAQTIAVQAAANKANNVPTPKNSPSQVSSRPSSNMKQAGTMPNGNSSATGNRNKGKSGDQVAKKSGTEVNTGANRGKSDSAWSQQQVSGNKGFVQTAIPKPGSNKFASVETLPGSQQQGKAHRAHQQAQGTQKHNVTLSPSPGGAARVTGMVISPSHGTSVPESGSRAVNCGSYPVRKNGSPVLNKSIRLEAVEKKNDLHYRKPDGKEIPRDNGSGFGNDAGQKPPLKRKLVLPKSSEEECSPDSYNAAKRLKIGLPSSTDVTSKRLPSPPKLVDSDSSKSGPKKAMSPLQKLSDLQRNGGLTVACLKHTETGLQTLPMSSSNLEQAVDGKSGSGTVVVTVGGTGTTLNDFSVITPGEKASVFSTPAKNSNSHGATAKVAAVQPEAKPSKKEEGKDNTKDKTSNVTSTLSPRAFKLAALSTPGSSKPTVSPLMERRSRPQRAKRLLVNQKEVEVKQEKPEPVIPVTRKLKADKITSNAVKKTRGRKARSHLNLPLRKPNNRINGYHNQFNGSVTPNDQPEEKDGDTVDESAFEWDNATVKDLLRFGCGYSLQCLPKDPQGQNAKKEIAQAALKHLKEELTPRPPSYWSSSSDPRGKKPVNQKSRRDLKDVDSYYISGRRIDQNGIQCQVVWRDGRGFEYSSEDEVEMDMDFGANYIYFEEYDPKEYFRDKIPAGVLKGKCDSSVVVAEYEVNSDGMPVKDGFIQMGMSIPIKVKREPNDADKAKSSLAKMFTQQQRVQKPNGRIGNPVQADYIDLTDSS